MQSTIYPGIFKKKDKLFTQNPEVCKGIKVYNEQLITEDNIEYRSWNPFRSKLAAALLKGLTFDITADAQILYLGAATGTTVSHISDIITNGTIYAVEIAPVAVINLLKVSEKRPNIIPILSDANHPERYQSIVPQVDLIYQDISQRNQAGIFTATFRPTSNQMELGLSWSKHVVLMSHSNQNKHMNSSAPTSNKRNLKSKNH